MTPAAELNAALAGFHIVELGFHALNDSGQLEALAHSYGDVAVSAALLAALADLKARVGRIEELTAAVVAAHVIRRARGRAV